MPKTIREPGVFLTQAEVAAFFGVSRERIHQIETKALRKIRAAIKREACKQGVSIEEWLNDNCPSYAGGK